MPVATICNATGILSFVLFLFKCFYHWLMSLGKQFYSRLNKKVYFCKILHTLKSMIKKTISLLAGLFFVLLLNAQEKLTAYTRAFLDNYVETANRAMPASALNDKSALFVKAKSKDGVSTIGAFIVLKDDAETDWLEDFGVKIYKRSGKVVTAEIPVDKIVSVSEQEDVLTVDVEKPVRLLNDASRIHSRADEVQAGSALNQPYTGNGVVVGICDQGIDFNHIAFMDADGKTRVKRAYLSDDRSGTPPSGINMYGGRFSGSAYETSEEIATLTTDYNAGSHGTHTSGTAAGSYMGNNYYGYAPGADLVLCGMASLTNMNIANSMMYVFDYAASVNKPAVINCSLGDDLGPHDGTSSLELIMDELSGEGRIISIAAGNEGSDPLYATKSFENPEDELKVLLTGINGGYNQYSGIVDAWSRTGESIGVKAVVYDLSKNEVVYETPVVDDRDYVVYSSAGIPELAKYYNGTITFYTGIDNNNQKYNIYCQVNLTALSQWRPNYCVGLVYTGDTGQQVDVWADAQNTLLATLDIPGWTNGTPDCSINSMATGDQTISVGSYNSKVSYKAINGGQYGYGDRFPENEISSFSSSGIDMRGISRPDVLAPGAIIVSPVNGYDSYTVKTQRMALAEEVKGENRNYHWGDMIGTSMATPAVTGIIALWLEADPTLTPDRIKEIINKTSVKDAYVANSPVRSGAGKIDAYAGLLEVLKGATGLDAERNINKVLISAPVDGNFEVYAPGETGRVTVNIYSPNGMLLYTITQSNEGTVEVKAGDLQKKGVHILQVLGEKTNYRTKIVLN